MGMGVYYAWSARPMTLPKSSGEGERVLGFLTILVWIAWPLDSYFILLQWYLPQRPLGLPSILGSVPVIISVTVFDLYPRIYFKEVKIPFESSGIQMLPVPCISLPWPLQLLWSQVSPDFLTAKALLPESF